MTPFSVYQGRYNCANRDMEAEIIPMCQDQGMAVVPWAALGGGQLMTAEQRKENEKKPDARKYHDMNEHTIRVSEALEKIANARDTTLQAVVSSASRTANWLAFYLAT